jgi:acyl transferase domain-containing protein/NADPH:quinone reductase-like Zn-dependent oxidoreductase/acyl carrier protein
VTGAFDYPSVAAIAGYLASQITSCDEDEQQDEDLPQHISTVQRRPRKPKASSHDRTSLLQSQVSAVAASVLGSDVGPDEPLMDAGMDSLGSVEFKNAVTAQLGFELPVTAAFDYPSVAAIAGYLASQLSEDCEDEKDDSSEYSSADACRIVSSRNVPHQEGVDVVSVASKAPGGPLSALAPGEGLSPVPLGRWDVGQQCISESRIPAVFGGFLEDAELFDDLYFGISQSEAVLMDPQQRLVQQMAGQTFSSLSHDVVHNNDWSDMGIFVGISTTDYGKVAANHLHHISAYSATGGALSVAAGRLSYFYGASGPSMSVDTACSSSLVSTHLACMSNAAGHATSNLSSGVNLTLDPTTTATFHSAGMLAPDGRCKTLDASADGYVRGESCASLLLRGQCSDSDSALICQVQLTGTAVNQDGRSSSLTAPNGPSQQKVIRQGLVDAMASPTSMCLLQMHGTGTGLGDPIEMGAVSAVLINIPAQQLTNEMHPISVAAVKAAVGHTEAGAGATGLVHTRICLVDAAAAPLAQLRQLSPHLVNMMFTSQARTSARSVVLPKSPVPVQYATVDHSPKLAGVSSFAFQGTNAHAILAPHTSVPTNSLYASMRPFHQHRYWPYPHVHPLLRSSIMSPKSHAHYITRLQCAVEVAGLHDHRVSDRPLFPGAGFTEIACSASYISLTDILASSHAILGNISVPVPLVLPHASSKTASHVPHLNCAILPGLFELWTASHQASAPIPHMKGQLTMMLSTLPTHIAQHHVFAHSPAVGVTVQAISQPRAHSLHMPQGIHARVLPAQSPQHAAFWAHPASLDASMQISAAKTPHTTSKSPQQMRVPAAMVAYHIHSHVSGPLAHAAAYVSAQVSADGSVSSSHHLTSDPAINTGACIYELVTKPMSSNPKPSSSATPSSMRTLTYTVNWHALSKTPLCNISAQPRIPSPNSALSSVSRSSPSTAMYTSALMQISQHLSTSHKPTLLMRAHNAQLHHTLASVPSASICTAHSALLGLLRTASQECPTLDARTINTQHMCNDNSVANGTAVPTDKHGRWINPYGVSLQCGTSYSAVLLASNSPIWMHPIHLTPSPRGSMSRLIASPLLGASTSDLAQGMQLDVHAVGINFRDVLNVLGMYPGDPGPPGGDCSGVVVSHSTLASDKSSLISESIFGLAPGCLGTRCATIAELVAPKPDSLRYDESASMPTVCMTVNIMLNHANHVDSSDRVLVTASAGGVGSAAMLMLEQLHASTIASAGNGKKRILARTMHAQCTASSRDTTFVQTCAVVTSGFGGASAVLNSLTSSGMVAASFGTMSASARFAEIGKREVWSGSLTHMERSDVSYTMVALDFVPPSTMTSLVTLLSCAAATATTSPLSRVVQPLGAVRSAMRNMMQAQHAGKLVVQTAAPLAICASESALLTGGLGNLGSLIAGWLAANTVACVRLAGRTGHTTHVPDVLAKATTGESVSVVSTERLDAGLSSEARAPCFRTSRVTGILVHAGGVLHDCTLPNQNASSVYASSAAKVSALQNLQHDVRMVPFHLQVYFSSVASLMGSAGQSNYSAANSALDAAAQHHHSCGSVSASVQWGAWGGGGMAANDKSTKLRMDRTGMGMLTPLEGLQVMSTLLVQDQRAAGATVFQQPLLAANPFTWTKLLKQMPLVPDLFQVCAEDTIVEYETHVLSAFNKYSPLGVIMFRYLPKIDTGCIESITTKFVWIN